MSVATLASPMEVIDEFISASSLVLRSCVDVIAWFLPVGLGRLITCKCLPSLTHMI